MDEDAHHDSDRTLWILTARLVAGYPFNSEK